MTSAQLDHLRRIDAHLANLLSTAEKRTGGEWYPWVGSSTVQVGLDRDPALKPCIVSWAGFDACGLSYFRQKKNAAFIASCAGNAEAGWKATRAAIAHILSGGNGHDNGEDILATSILAAFPLESLKA